MWDSPSAENRMAVNTIIAINESYDPPQGFYLLLNKPTITLIINESWLIRYKFFLPHLIT